MVLVWIYCEDVIDGKRSVPPIIYRMPEAMLAQAELYAFSILVWYGIIT